MGALDCFPSGTSRLPRPRVPLLRRPISGLISFVFVQLRAVWMLGVIAEVGCGAQVRSLKG